MKGDSNIQITASTIVACAAQMHMLMKSSPYQGITPLGFWLLSFPGEIWKKITG